MPHKKMRVVLVSPCKKVMRLFVQTNVFLSTSTLPTAQTYRRAMQPARKINIALDGYAGCGKSTTAERVARALGYIFIDTGSMYRAFTLYLLREGISHHDAQTIAAVVPHAQVSFRLNAHTGKRETILNHEPVEDKIRTLEVSAIVSEVSAHKAVRTSLVEQQRRLGREKGVVMDGRDIGTVVFPDAELKVFMTAALEARMQRRKRELEALGQLVDMGELRENLLHRDYLDTTRQESPLRRAPDARLLDTTDMTIDAQVETVVAWANELIYAPA